MKEQIPRVEFDDVEVGFVDGLFEVYKIRVNRWKIHLFGKLN